MHDLPSSNTTENYKYCNLRSLSDIYRIIRAEIICPRSTKALIRRKAVDAVTVDRDNGLTFTDMRRRNMFEIMAHTPRWVFILFIGFVLLGLQQSRARTVTRKRLPILPL